MKVSVYVNCKRTQPLPQFCLDLLVSLSFVPAQKMEHFPNFIVEEMTTKKNGGCLFLSKEKSTIPRGPFILLKNKTNVWENTSQWSVKGKEKISVSQLKRDQ